MLAVSFQLLFVVHKVITRSHRFLCDCLRVKTSLENISNFACKTFGMLKSSVMSNLLNLHDSVMYFPNKSYKAPKWLI